MDWYGEVNFVPKFKCDIKNTAFGMHFVNRMIYHKIHFKNKKKSNILFVKYSFTFCGEDGVIYSLFFRKYEYNFTEWIFNWIKMAHMKITEQTNNDYKYSDFNR